MSVTGAALLKKGLDLWPEREEPYLVLPKRHSTPPSSPPTHLSSHGRASSSLRPSVRMPCLMAARVKSRWRWDGSWSFGIVSGVGVGRAAELKLLNLQPIPPSPLFLLPYPRSMSGRLLSSVGASAYVPVSCSVFFGGG